MAKNKNPYMGIMDFDEAREVRNKYIDKWNNRVDKGGVEESEAWFAKGFCAALCMAVCPAGASMYGKSPYKFMRNAYEIEKDERGDREELLEHVKEVLSDEDNPEASFIEFMRSLLGDDDD